MNLLFFIPLLLHFLVRICTYVPGDLHEHESMQEMPTHIVPFCTCTSGVTSSM